MDELSSTEFRKTFARLTSPTVVTVNGHVMGTWHPAMSLYDPKAYVGPPERYFERFDTQPVRAVPKVKKR